MAKTMKQLETAANKLLREAQNANVAAVECRGSIRGEPSYVNARVGLENAEKVLKDIYTSMTVRKDGSLRGTLEVNVDRPYIVVAAGDSPAYAAPTGAITLTVRFIPSDS